MSPCGFIVFGDDRNLSFLKNDLNIAMVVRDFSPSGGLELYTHKVIEGLLERGNSVTVFCQSTATDFTHPKLKVQPMKPRPEGLTKSERSEHDYEVANHALSEVSGFDIVHSQHYPTAHADVVTFHNHSVLRWSSVGLGWEKLVNDTKYLLMDAYKLRDFQDRVLCANADCLVFPSEIMHEDYFSAYPFLQKNEKSFVVAMPGSTLYGEKPASSAKCETARVEEKRPFSFIFVGRGFRRKGLDVLFNACSKLAQDGRDFRLLIAGMDAKPLDHARLMHARLQGKVSYLGFRSDMENVYAMADVAVLPSRVEPFGMGPLQAMKQGLVPVVSRVAGVSEVLKHEHDSLILENHLDASELHGLMSRLMDEPELLKKLATEAKVTASNVTWQQTVINTLHAYDLAIANRSRRQSEATVK